MPISLFWRTFLMIGALIVVSVLAALQLARMFDRSPPEQQLAWEITSIINLTRVALVNTPSDKRPILLGELAREEGVLVTPLETTDEIEPVTRNASFSDAVQSRLRPLLGYDTRLAARVNGEPGLWVSFDIDGDPYWLVLKQERFERQIGPDWLLIGLLTVAMSAIGALVISRFVNRPLARLAGALERVSRGEQPETLPEGVTSEIAQVNLRFNRMASELASIESDRAVALAGISHDIRTPLSRLRMEIELSPLPDSDKDSMSSEIERINQIVGKFLDYARSGQSEQGPRDVQELRAGTIVQEICDRMNASATDVRIRYSGDPAERLLWRGDPIDLERILSNLIENARRYGRGADGIAEVDVRLQVWSSERVLAGRLSRGARGIVLAVRDHGPGVDAGQLGRLMRPFSRADDARSYEGGSGLGLTIVDRTARRYLGHCEIANASDGGFIVSVYLGHAPKSANSRSTRN